MTGADAKQAYAGIGVPAPVLKRLDEETIAGLAGLGADVVLVADEAGTIRRSYVSSDKLAPYGFAAMTGRKLQDCVTMESVEKIDAMLGRQGDANPNREYQVNHFAEGLQDLPVAYRAHASAGFPYLLLVGHDISRQMVMQQRLVEAQIELEADYRELQEAESRYRTVFQISPEAVLLLDGEKKTVLDANPAAASLLSAGAGRLIGKPLRDLVDRKERDRLVDALSEARHSGATVTIDSMETGRGEPVSLAIRSYRENRLTNLAISIWPAREAEAATVRAGMVEPDRGERLRHLPEAAILTDSRGRVLAANDLFLDLVQAPAANQVVGRAINTWFGGSSIDIQVLLARVTDEKAVRGFSSTLRDNLSGEKPVQLSARMNPDDNTIQIIVTGQPALAGKVAVQPLGIPDQSDGFTNLVGKVPMKDLIRESLDVIEKMCIEAALEQTNNNRASAAELLGLSRQSLYIKLRRHGLEDYRPGGS